MATPLAGLGQAASNPLGLAKKALDSPRLLEELIQGLAAAEARIKYRSAKALRIVSEEDPAALYPWFDFFLRQLAHKNKILQWEAAFVLSQLARVDAADRLTAAFAKYFAPIPGPVMITAANVIRGGARIAQAKPHLADRIATEVLKVARARYQTSECRNVAIGHAIVALGDFYDRLRRHRPVLQFVCSQLKNPRPATRKKAAKFLKRAERSCRLPLTKEETAVYGKP